MTLVSNDPSWWPIIDANLISSYFVVASCAGVMYDWGLTFGPEVELIWRQRWSLMTVLYLIVRYVGIGYAVISLLLWVPTISTTDAGCRTMYDAFDWTGVVADAMLGVIVIARLYAMYQQSRKVLIFLVVIFVTIRIANVVMVAITMMQISGEGLLLFGTFQCTIGYAGDATLLYSITWILGTVWEVTALCLAVWIAVKHFRELRQHATSGILEDVFTVLMETHVSYFASFLVVSCFEMSYLSPTFSTSTPYLEIQIYSGFVQIFQMAQMFVLGPRLILSLREYHAKLVADSDAATVMTSICYQERVHVETGSGV
jgi:preprotein translocase subunit SecG